MVKEAYVSPEVAELLRKKGFDIICDKVYREQDKYLCPLEYCMNLKGEGFYLAPTHQMAMAWLREKGFHIVTSISFDTSEDADGNIVDKRTFWFFEILSSFEGNLIYTEEIDEYDSNEQAVEASLKYVLNNLL